MKHAASAGDLEFQQQFLACGLSPAQFHHRDHLRLAYVFLVQHGSAEAAYPAFRAPLLEFLRHHGIDPAKYHATLTQAWLLAVMHFMEVSEPVHSADEFLGRNSALLDPQIMFTHYSRELIKSPDSRAGFVEPDIQQIPRHA